MESDTFEIILADVPDKDNLIVEIYYNNMYWAELSQETSDVVVEFYSHPTNKCWEFNLDKAMSILVKAKQELTEDYSYRNSNGEEINFEKEIEGNMRIGNFEIMIASVPHRENVVADIYYNDMYWAELSQETSDVVVRFYSHPTNKCWEFNLDKAMSILAKAKQELTEDYS